MSQRRAAHLRRQASVEHPRYPPPSTVPAQPQPQQQYQHLAQPSDYESDTPAYLSDYPSQPPPATRTNEELNLSVLRRYNSDIVSILSIAPYAVVYEFSPLPEPLWTKNGVEGSLFLTQLKQGTYGEDRYAAFVLNRRGLDNFEAELLEGENTGVEITQEYVIISFKDGHEQKINGIFIFSEGPGTSTEYTRAFNADLMKKLAVQAGLSRKVAEAAATESTAPHTNGQKQADAAFRLGERSPPSVERDIHVQRYGGSRQAQIGTQPVPQQSEVLLNLFAGNGQAHPATRAAPQQPDVLMDLFRNAGLPKT